MNDGAKVLLAFDFGMERIGVAVGQTITTSAHPLVTLTAHGGRPDWSAVERLMEAWRPARLVVGLPLNLDGTDQPITVAARRFSRQLEGRFHVPVDLVDERLTTREAWMRVEEAGSKRAEIDPVAAQIILEGWFAEHPSR
jgi:putative holliday junction resolvase